ncbi:MAG: NAD(P)/FAD-dependent oxidoreductase [Anaerolineales bacterium]
MKRAQELPRVVIIGAGFGGLTAARELAGAPVLVHLIDRNNYHLFQPLLYQVATAGLEPEQIAKPVRAILRGQKNLRFQMGRVLDIDLAGKRVLLEDSSVPYDFLIIAAGAQTSFFGLPGVAEHAQTLKQLEDGVSLRNHVLRCFEEAAVESDPAARRELLSFVIVGGGPTGVEMAGALSELIHLVLVKDYPELDSDQVSLQLLELLDQILPGFPGELAARAKRELERKGIDVKLGVEVASYDGRRALTAAGDEISARTLIWSAGVQANRLVQNLGIGMGRAGRVIVENSLQLPEYESVYVIGDAAYMEADGEPLPMMAPVAIQMAERAVRNVELQLEGKEPEAFEYRDPGSLATIGRNAAVASVKGFRFSGFIAWVVWLVVHLIQLIGFRNRVLVLVNWAWDYFFYDRAVRLITERSPVPDES